MSDISDDTVLLAVSEHTLGPASEFSKALFAGTEVGCFEGLFVTGFGLGWAVGMFVIGNKVGCRDGETIGAVDGAADGAVDGCREGDLEGGKVVGAIVPEHEPITVHFSFHRPESDPGSNPYVLQPKRDMHSYTMPSD